MVEGIEPASYQVSEKYILLQIENLTKRFPQVLAVDCVSLNVRRGEIHCLLGENGAGKTTLAECIYGYFRPDSGVIYFKGQRIDSFSPADSVSRGIGMVHQHFELIEPLSVIENVVLGVEGEGFRLDLTQAEKKLKDLCVEYGVVLDLNAKIWQLSVGQRQWVEILKTLFVGADLLIFDEPTAVLTPQESENLFSVLQRMKQEGLSIILITHKLKEVMEVSDRVSVLRKGKHIATGNTRDMSQSQLARLMVGRDVLLSIDKEDTLPGKPILDVQNISVTNEFGRQVVHNLSLQVRENEVLGIAGVSGNGQKELSEALIGMRKPKAGEIYLNGVNITQKNVKEIMVQGMGHIPQDRINEGLVLEFPVDLNLILGMEDKKPFQSGLFLDEKAILEYARKCITEFDISTSSPKQPTGTLSGGNLQKVILARELSQSPKCLIANQPTRGLDVGAIEYVHQLLLEQRSRGAAILLISEDLDEILSLSDRIAVMFKGQILGVFASGEIELEKIGLLMAGIHD